MKKKLLVILGPTATGKTDLAIHLANKFNGELVSCDSRQVYQGLDIGTGKLPGGGKWEVRRGIKKWEVGGVMIWMYDVVSPKIQYTVADYVKDASRVIGEIRQRGKLPILVGGTGLYLKAILYGLSNLSVPLNQKLRKELNKLSVSKLQKKLQEVSYAKWNSMNYSDQQNPRRLIRAIELAMSNHGGDPSVVSLPQDDKLRLGIIRSLSNVLKIGLTAKRDVLYKITDLQVVERISQGMVEEAKKLHKNALTFKRMKQLGLEYGVLADYLSGKIKTLDELIRIMQNRIHRFVRRQLTWFKKEKGVVWFDITDKDYPANVEKMVDRWYHHLDDTKN